MKREFDWFAALLQQRLGPLQQAQNNPTLDLTHVMLHVRADDIRRLSDTALIRALDTYRSVQGAAGHHIRSLIAAEQARREGGKHRHVMVATWLTFIVAVATLVVTLRG